MVMRSVPRILKTDPENEGKIEVWWGLWVFNVCEIALGRKSEPSGDPRLFRQPFPLYNRAQISFGVRKLVSLVKAGNDECKQKGLRRRR